ncbi:uncharacterized protein BCR38DRAFT_228699 [Pseudomassariella vexata]|uniref:Uncharacterized protein n=1 Tax=Pseudomassariella vexata TaxID=1141098 RepID=A0A1Y2DWG8_9PEZI|nr:uncharacterized protein BCR38DRAFT_228699 [Pseudomassariella vexata]ORY63454.1 hypothetical protein BCR38DRAFT_228699 [Pseudomassariella vexata]
MLRSTRASMVESSVGKKPSAGGDWPLLWMHSKSAALRVVEIEAEVGAGIDVAGVAVDSLGSGRPHKALPPSDFVVVSQGCCRLTQAHGWHDGTPYSCCPLPAAFEARPCEGQLRQPERLLAPSADLRVEGHLFVTDAIRNVPEMGGADVEPSGRSRLPKTLGVIIRIRRVIVQIVREEGGLGTADGKAVPVVRDCWVVKDV